MLKEGLTETGNWIKLVNNFLVCRIILPISPDNLKFWKKAINPKPNTNKKLWPWRISWDCPFQLNPKVNHAAPIHSGKKFFLFKLWFAVQAGMGSPLGYHTVLLLHGSSRKRDLFPGHHRGFISSSGELWISVVSKIYSQDTTVVSFPAQGELWINVVSKKGE